jgi:hypothetical protein
MKERHSYIGTLNDVNGVWCDKKPKGLKVTEEITFYSADEGKVFTKDGELFDSVVIKDGVKIEDYIEIIDPRQKEEGNGDQEESQND